MKAAGARCDLFTVEGAPHGIGGWESHPEWQGYKTYVIEWLSRIFADAARQARGAAVPPPSPDRLGM